MVIVLRGCVCRFMGAIIVILIITVFIKKFIPLKGLLWDEDIASIVRIGSPKKVIVKQQYVPSVNVSRPESLESIPLPTEPTLAEAGIDLEDIKAKEHDVVNTDYIFANMDSSQQTLKDVVMQGIESGSEE